ncbi:MAG: MsnO8 family LLM class oxidoreductase [Dehalococcoidia bacterium]|nr:MsnO8 family LLM class oxidoreductase [Dehalococcoidia bacterium]
MRLSVLDLVPIPSGSTAEQAFRNMLELAQLVERLGYGRFWVAEHHGGERFAASAPEVLIPAVAAVTARIRVGSGAVLTRYHSPLKVAELFCTLSALYPGRVDLGVGRGRGATAGHAEALLPWREPAESATFLLELLGFLTGSFPEGHPYAGIHVAPAPAELPDPWILGTSAWSAERAAELGLPLAYSVFLAHDDPKAAFETYKRNYNREGVFPEPYAIIAVDAVCGDSTEQARELAFEPGDEPGIAGWSGPVLGTPAGVAEELRALAERLGADEVMVSTLIDDHAARLRSYELLAAELLA